MNKKFNFFKLFPRIYTRLFKSLYKNRLDYNLSELLKNGLSIETIYDIGAYKGEWSTYYNKTSLKNKKFYLFEANQSNEKFLSNTKFNYYIDVLSDSKKKLKFYTKGLTGDSYYRELSERYSKDLKFNLISTNTLNDIVEKNNLDYPNFVKIDTQGSEIDILKGANKVLANCNLLYLETPIIEYNLGSPNFSETVKYLNSIGFIPYDICEIHYMDKMLIQIDILYIRKKKFLEIFPKQQTIDLLTNETFY